MRISDWSSDVCSSDLKHAVGIGKRLAALGLEMQTPPRAEALEDIVRARAGGDEFGFGRAFEIRAAKAQGALKATVLVQHHPRRDQRRPWQMIGERSEEHTSELQSLMRISYAVFCLKKKKHKTD